MRQGYLNMIKYKNQNFTEMEFKIYLLSGLSLDARGVMFLYGCGKTKAYQVMKLVREKYNGSIPGFTNRIRLDAFLQMYGSTVGDQLLEMGINPNHIRKII